MSYIISKAILDDIEEMRNLIKQRIDWMDRVGIKQWNNTNYLDTYPISYFRDNIDYFYVARKDNKIVGLMAAYTQDPRWPDKKNAYYIHHLTVDINEKGLGNIMMDYIENKALKDNVQYIRLDSAIGNEKLENYYNNRGYIEYGECVDGLYKGILREKRIY